jgi:CelD/BcsL family acetyltransferase involved in cellulose biosynthesis
VNFPINNPAEHPDWDDLLLTNDQASFFHTAAWARVLCDAYDYKPLYLTLKENGRLVGLMPVMEIKSLLTGKRGVSLPFTDMCEPLAKDEETFAALLKAVTAVGMRAGWKYLELRGGKSYLRQEPVSAEFLAHTLELNADETKVEAKLKPTIRRNIRKAQKEGVTAKLECSLEAMEAYYRLHCVTRQRHGLPPQPWSFFRKIYDHIIASGHGFVALAGYQNQWIAGAVYVLFRDQAIYKYGASDRNFQHLRPNNLVMWAAIRWCCHNAIRTFSFGRTEPENEGLLQFKRGWGGVENKLTYYRYDLRGHRFVANASQSHKLNSLFRRMPVPLLRMSGHLLYRHMG